MKSITLIILFLISWNAFGQSKNKIQKYKITEIQEVYVDSMGNTQIGLIQRMDEKGNIIYLEEYNKRGVLKIKEAYIYLKNGNLAEKKVLNKEGQTVQKEKYSYSLDLNTLVEIFDKNDSLIEYTVISYNGFGEKKWRKFLMHRRNELKRSSMNMII